MPESQYSKFFENTGGLNLTDSPIRVKDSQATGQSYNFDYSTIGAISKVLAASVINSAPDTQLKTLGLNILHDSITDARTILRAAGTKLQTFNTSTSVFTNIAEDTTVAGTDFLTSGTTSPVSCAPFNALLGGTRNWLSGGQMGPLYGVNGSFVTKNGAEPALGYIALSLTSSGSGGTWGSTGSYTWSIGLRKRQTLSQSNAGLDLAITVDDVTKGVVIDLSKLNIDSTKYDQILIYRSTISGTPGFTTGNIVAQLPSTTTTYTDIGASIASSQVIPRAGGTTDNSPLPAGTAATLTLGGIVYTASSYLGTLGNSVTVAYTGGGTAGSEVVTVSNYAISVQIQSGVTIENQIVTAINNNYAAKALVTASGSGSATVTTHAAASLTGGLNGVYNTATTFRRRLVTAQNGSVYISDLNKDESWPLANVFTPPSGGPVVAVATVGVNSEYTTGADQYLLIFKEREMWAITGNDISDWQLQFIAQVGCVNQNCIMPMSGYVFWMAFNGIYAWDGQGKPVRISRPINALWDTDGDLDKTMIKSSWATYYEKGNVVCWRTSSRIKGTQKLMIKMDVRLTIPAVSQNVGNLEADGIFNLDTDSNAYYAGCSYRSSGYNEQFLVGDNAGYIYQLYSGAGASSFDYETSSLDCGMPDRNKLFKRVFVYVERLLDVDLTLYYWSDYKRRDSYRSQMSLSMVPVAAAAPALWDIAIFDQSYFDDYVPDIGIMEFNLHPEENNIQGMALKLRFEQLAASAPVRIHGFVIEWEDLGPITIPVPIAG